MFPRLGPRSGGTQLTLTGSNLDTGANLTVTLGDRPCHVTSRDAANVTCVTSASQEASSDNQVVVAVDGATRRLRDQFEFTPGKMVIWRVMAARLNSGAISVMLSLFCSLS